MSQKKWGSADAYVIPPHVEYSLSAKKGVEVAEKIYELVNWIEKNTN